MGICLFFSGAQAQERLKFNLGVNSGMPVGKFADFMGRNSFRGFHGGVNYLVTERLSVGLGVAYNDYYEKHPRRIYQSSEGTVSAVVTNSVQTTPIMIKAAYDLTGQGWIRPYAGVGAGFNLINYRQYLGEFADGRNAFKPAFAADAGVNIPFNKTTRSAGINMGANFNFMPFDFDGLDNLNNWGLHLGVFFPMR